MRSLSPFGPDLIRLQSKANRLPPEVSHSSVMLHRTNSCQVEGKDDSIASESLIVLPNHGPAFVSRDQVMRELNEQVGSAPWVCFQLTCNAA